MVVREGEVNVVDKGGEGKKRGGGDGTWRRREGERTGDTFGMRMAARAAYESFLGGLASKSFCSLHSLSDCARGEESLCPWILLLGQP